MFLVIDNASNNILAEFDGFPEAEQCRISVVGANPMLATHVEVVDLDRTVDAYKNQHAFDGERQPA